LRTPLPTLADLKSMKCIARNPHLLKPNKKVSKKSKYGNVKVVFDNHSFDSQKECNVYISLRMRLRAKEITDLRLQVPYSLNKGGTFTYTYIADFTYLENGITIVADAKGFKTKVYLKKKKLMLHVYNITVLEF